MRYFNLDTLQEATRSEIVSNNPNTSYPPTLSAETLTDLGYAALERDPTPELGVGDTVVAGEVRREGNRVIQGWKIIPALEEPEDAVV